MLMISLRLSELLDLVDFLLSPFLLLKSFLNCGALRLHGYRFLGEVLGEKS